MINQKTATTLIAIGSLMTALIAIMVYVNTRDHRKLQKDILLLDKELKKSQLDNLNG